jgi:predicted secreted protein
MHMAFRMLRRPLMKNLDADDADRTVTIEPGEEVSIRLDENPTAGYRWTVASVSDGVTIVASDFEAAPGGRPGAGGQRTLRLRAGNEGTAELVVRYERAGGDQSGSARSCRFRFTVKPA